MNVRDINPADTTVLERKIGLQLYGFTKEEINNLVWK
jgi:hypothetical protein